MSELLENWKRLSRDEQKILLLESLQDENLRELAKKVIHDVKWDSFGTGIVAGTVLFAVIITVTALLL